MAKMRVLEALQDLIKAGADITQTGENTFLVKDNGFHGFLKEEDPFEVDGEDLLEMHNQYITGPVAALL